jgi:hypothetical protein
MDFKENTGKTIEQAFREFHKANPKIYLHFCRLIFKAEKRGVKRISADLIINVIRWEVFITPKVKEKTNVQLGLGLESEPKKFKINNNYVSHYARMFIKEFPDKADLFELRGLRS